MSGTQARFVTVFAGMKVGDSFACPYGAGKSLVTSAQRWGKGCGRKFLMRRVNEGQARIWRTE